MKVVAVLSLASVASAKIFFQESFDELWKDRWVLSSAKGADQGEWKLSAGKYFADKEKDQGLQTSQDSKFYGASAKFNSFSNKGKDLVVQFSVKHEQFIDCGGGYIKLYPSDLEQENMHGDTPYHIMFGPDICGSTKRVHVIFTYKGKNLLKKVDIPAKHDETTHLYTLIVKADNTYEVQVDMDKVAGGKLEDDWEFLQPSEIDDPEATKPEDWDERAKIPDTDDKKPDGWDAQPEFIVDPEAKKPEDWDDEDDGEWEAPQIPNPDYKGEWSPRMVDNPEYRGKWVKPKISNPAYVEDKNLYQYKDIGAIGLDLWQVKSGSIFDNILVTDSVKEATKIATETFKVTVEGEKKAKEEVDKIAEAEMKKVDEEMKAKAEQDTVEKTTEDEDEVEEEQLLEEIKEKETAAKGSDKTAADKKTEAAKKAKAANDDDDDDDDDDEEKEARAKVDTKEKVAKDEL